MTWPVTLRRRILDQPELETWANHLDLRELEMGEICAVAGLGTSLGDVLEIGCGNAYGSAFLATGATRVVATDLPSISTVTHSIGLERAVRLLDATALSGRVSVAGCSGEALPFRDRSFDVVFGLYMLEHVPDKGACLREMHRVLRPGGIAVMAVPARAWSAMTPVAVYQGLFTRLVRRLLSRLRRRRTTPARGRERDREGTAPTSGGSLGSLRAAYPAFPLPSPHGSYRSWAEELRSQSPDGWRSLFRPVFGEVDVLPLAVVPYPAASIVLGRWAFRAYRRFLLPLDRRLRSRPALLPWAQFYCVVARRA
jgi:SAM-dependent methyltransferase